MWWNQISSFTSHNLMSNILTANQVRRYWHLILILSCIIMSGVWTWPCFPRCTIWPGKLRWYVWRIMARQDWSLGMEWVVTNLLLSLVPQICSSRMPPPFMLSLIIIWRKAFSLKLGSLILIPRQMTRRFWRWSPTSLMKKDNTVKRNYRVTLPLRSHHFPFWNVFPSHTIFTRYKQQTSFYQLTCTKLHLAPLAELLVHVCKCSRKIFCHGDYR